jgi:hypothetical protein
MANIRKSFNFRDGLQVDTDNFIVNPVGNVGIGTTIANEYMLNVYGINAIRGVGISTLDKLNIGVGTATTMNATTSNMGNLTCDTITLSGQGTQINNIIGFATDGFNYITNIPNKNGLLPPIENPVAGLVTSISVGLGTTVLSDYTLLIGQDPSGTDTNGISFTGSDGSVTATGSISAGSYKLGDTDIITADEADTTVAATNLSGLLKVSDLTTGVEGSESIAGTLLPEIPNGKIPTNIDLSRGGTVTGSGITAATFTGDLTGTASTASDLETTATVTIASASAGTMTATTSLSSKIIGVGDADVSSQSIPVLLRVQNDGVDGEGTELEPPEHRNVEAEFTGTLGHTRLSFGQSSITGTGSSAGYIMWGKNGNSSVEIGNRHYGDFVFNNNVGNTYDVNSGQTAGNFVWQWASSDAIMTLSHDGRLGVGGDSHATEKLKVTGSATIDNLTLTGSLTATNATLTFDAVTADVTGDLTGNVTSSGISTFSDYVKIKSLNITNSTDNNTSPFYDSNAQSNAIGFANTEASSFLSNTGIGTQELHGNKLALEGSLAIYDENPTIAIGSTSIVNLADNSDSGNVQMHNTDVVILGGSINLLPKNFTDTSGEVTFNATYATVTDPEDNTIYGSLEGISSTDMAKLKVGMYIITPEGSSYTSTVRLNTRITEIIDESSVQLSKRFVSPDFITSTTFKGNMPSGTIGIGTTASTSIADFSGFTPGHSVGGLKLPVVTDAQRKTIAAEVGVVIYIRAVDLGDPEGLFICTEVDTAEGSPTFGQITWTPLTLGTSTLTNTIDEDLGYYGQA